MTPTSSAGPSVPPSVRVQIEREVNGELVREILVAMCLKQGISLTSPFSPDEEARNYTIAQRLGIGHIFGIPDNEKEDE